MVLLIQLYDDEKLWKENNTLFTKITRTQEYET